MNALVVDIETVGIDIGSLDEATQTYLMRSAEAEATEEAREEARRRTIDSMSLWPLTGRVVAIGLLNAGTERGRVYYEAAEEARWTDESTEFIGASEASILASFWELIPRYDRIVTFNGRSFDVPWLMLRSAVHGLRPSRNLLGSRYESRHHVDLLDQLTFYGATRKFTLDFYCKAFGIESPKAAGIDGSAIGRLHAEGRLEDIARYCWRDVQATGALYRRWRDTLGFEEA